MNRTPKIKRFIGAIIIGSSVLSFGSSAIANTDISPVSNQICSQVCHGKYNFNEKMTELVSKKIISQEQANKWVDYRQSKMAERKAEWEKIKNLPKEERREYWKKAKVKRLDEVVQAGIITQEQADQIKDIWLK
ncbi:hypothetical protein Dtox_2178 [Desulfofarcimen acetoxidans DSM 771]|uniref:Uncharacterized protein n=1 Tax=Desulfofarcimen acetoxidans (strain ATCC 49208 / DSM 771 / KCTC 5769 / VKM B-1644 / 5575) TaxID=485916 RepID=C8VZM1_DESAS|nr:hypothetical protein [Desulfofarcimen acetoxidans]ACV62999.1 hypothetical protein Dtox_2178 [Desulfofarcimen acetoxidans DSM 771]